MLEKTTIVRPYAEAAFSQALEEGKLSEWSTMLNLLSVIVRDSDMQRVVASPKISADELYQFYCQYAYSGIHLFFLSDFHLMDRLLLHQPH